MIPLKSVQKQILLQATICGESILKIMLQIAQNSVLIALGWFQYTHGFFGSDNRIIFSPLL